MKTKSLLLLTVFLFVKNISTSAQWNLNPDVNNSICLDIDDQYNPKICSDGNNGAVIVWEDYRNGNRDIYIQKVTSNGQNQWATGGVPVCAHSGEQYDFEIAPDGAGGAILVWTDNRNGSSDIYAQRMYSSGTPAWTVNGVAICNATGNQELAKLVNDGTGSAIMVWDDHRISPFNENIYAQKISSTGVIQWQANGIVICDTLYDQYLPLIVNDGSTGAIMIWQDYRSNAYTHIYAQRVNSSGTIQWATNGLMIISGTQIQLDTRYDAIKDDAGGAIFSWSHNKPGSGFIRAYTQRINQNGVPQWQANGVLCSIDSSTHQRFPKCVSDGNGGVNIVWWNFYILKVQKINSQGVRQWNNFGVDAVSYSPIDSYYDVAPDGAGGVIFTWQDSRAGSSDKNIYSNRVNTNGVKQWTNDAAVCTAQEDQFSPKIISDGMNGAIITWEDRRDGIDIYASRMFGSASKQLKVTSLIQGFYDNVLNKMVKDTARVYLRSANSPYAIVDNTSAVLDSAGKASFLFNNAANSTQYYIVFDHRNSIETWSAVTKSFLADTLSFNFTGSASQAFGNNTILKGSKYCIFNGDENRDGNVDVTDLIHVFNDANSFVSGYKATDMTGDNIVDATDVILTYNNSKNFINVMRP